MALMTGKLPVKNSRYHSKMQKAMKKTIILSVVAVTAAALVSCQKEQDNNVPEKPQGIPFEITAGTVDTKTANDDVHTTWVAGDKINLFHAEKDTDSYVSDGSFTAAADGASVAFNGTLGEALDGEKNYDWYALYPYENDYANSPASFDYVYIADRNNSYTQTQVGNDSKAHLAGDGYPLWGKKTNVAAATKPAITMNQMTSVIAVNVTNKIDAPITVSKVEFWTSAETHLVGEYRVNFSGTSPVLSNSAGEGIATLNVSGASALAKNASGVYYFAVKPFDAPAGSSLTIRVTTSEGIQLSENIVPAKYSFTAGKIYTLNFNFTNKTVNMAQFPYNDPAWLTAQSINPGGNSDKDLDGAAQTVDVITITSTDGGTKTRVHKTSGTPDTYDLRVYKNGGSLTIAPNSDSYVIEKVTFAGSGLTAAKLSADSGTYTEGTTTWTGLAQDVTFTASDTWNIKNIGVFYRTATASDHILIVPVKAFDAAYTVGSVDITIKQLNIADLVVDSSSAGYVDYSVAGNTITVNLSANGSTSPRDIVVSVSSASAGVDETVTITQAGAPTKINTLTASSTGVTINAQVAALTTKGFILADETGAILVYTNTDVTSTYTIGQAMKVEGEVSAYNKGLQFDVNGGKATVTPGAAGSYDYPAATAYSLSDVTSYIADDSDRLATYVQYSGVIPSSPSSYVNVCVGGVATANTGSYNIWSDLSTGLSKGDYVTVKGYASSVSGGRINVCVTSITKDDTVPALVYNNITGVSGEGVPSTDLAISAYRVTGWTPSLVSKPSWVTSATPAADCTKLSYVVEENGTTERSGDIVIRLTKGLTTYDYTIKITQDANLPKTTFTFSTIYSSCTTNCVITTDSQAGITLTYNKNEGTQPKYYNTGTAIRLYNQNTLEVSGGEKKIKKIVFTFGTDKGSWSVSSGGGSLTGSGGTPMTWTASSDVTSVVFGTTATARINTITITYQN